MARRLSSNKQGGRISENLSTIAINCRYQTCIISLFHPFSRPRTCPTSRVKAPVAGGHFATDGERRTRREKERNRNLLVFFRFLENAMRSGERRTQIDFDDPYESQRLLWPFRATPLCSHDRAVSLGLCSISFRDVRRRADLAR